MKESVTNVYAWLRTLRMVGSAVWTGYAAENIIIDFYDQPISIPAHFFKGYAYLHI